MENFTILLRCFRNLDPEFIGESVEAYPCIFSEFPDAGQVAIQDLQQLGLLLFWDSCFAYLVRIIFLIVIVIFCGLQSQWIAQNVAQAETLLVVFEKSADYVTFRRTFQLARNGSQYTF